MHSDSGNELEQPALSTRRYGHGRGTRDLRTSALPGDEQQGRTKDFRRQEDEAVGGLELPEGPRGDDGRVQHQNQESKGE